MPAAFIVSKSDNGSLDKYSHKMLGVRRHSASSITPGIKVQFQIMATVPTDFTSFCLLSVALWYRSDGTQKIMLRTLIQFFEISINICNKFMYYMEKLTIGIKFI